MIKAQDARGENEDATTSTPAKNSCGLVSSRSSVKQGSLFVVSECQYRSHFSHGHKVLYSVILRLGSKFASLFPLGQVLRNVSVEASYERARCDV